MVNNQELFLLQKKVKFLNNLENSVKNPDFKYLVKNPLIYEKIHEVFGKKIKGKMNMKDKGEYERKIILGNYAWLSRSKNKVVSEKNILEKRNQLLEKSCLKFKDMISDLESKFIE